MSKPLRLTFLQETNQARLYQLGRGKQQWVPRSVITRCLGTTPRIRGDMHDVVIEEWWLKENPFVVKAAGQEELL